MNHNIIMAICDRVNRLIEERNERFDNNYTDRVVRAFRAFEWFSNQREFTLTPPTNGDKKWYLFHNDDTKSLRGDTLLEVIERAI